MKYKFIIIALVFCFSCKKENRTDCFKSTGKNITEIRFLSAFQKIIVFDNMDAFIIKGNEFKVEITAGEHLLKNITSIVNNGVLSLNNINKCNFVRGYKRKINITITLPYIKLATNEGVGTLRFEDNFIQDTVVVRAGNSGDIYVDGIFNEIRTSSHGNGDIYVSGKANSFFVYSNGINFLKAKNLNVKNFMFIHTFSIGDCEVNADGCNDFSYNIGNSGNIYYYGNPLQTRDVSEISAKGKAIKKE